MKKIDLSKYKDFRQYFVFYDIEIKGVKSNKEAYLEKKGISPSSYRRAKNDGNKIGIEILEKLNKEFSYEMIDNEIIDEIEDIVNRIYYNVYYKKTDYYEEDMLCLERKLEENLVVFPILLLMKLFLLVNSKIKPKRTLDEFSSIYTKVQKYKKFYNDDLQEILEILNISFQEELDSLILGKNYKNELTYFALSSKCILEKKYIESIYFAEKAKQIFIKDEKAKRIYYINLNLMSAYNYLERYEECNLLAMKQMMALESYKCFEFEYTAAKKHYIISCLGLGHFNTIINMFEKAEKMNKTEICCLLISLYKINKEFYKKYYLSITTSDICSRSDREFYEILNNIIVKKQKNLISDLESHKITTSVIEIMKKCKF